LVLYLRSVKRILISLFTLISAAQLYAGTITQNVSTLSNFGNVYPFHSSTSLRYTVSGSALSADLIITAPNGFEVSLIYGYGYSKTITLSPSSGTVTTTTVFARFSPSVAGAASGNIVNSSVGSTSQNISVNGTCIAWGIPASYYSTVNTQSGAALKTVLYTKILGHTDIPYGSGTTCTNCVWGAYQTTDVQPNGKVWDIYSTRFDQASPYEYTMRTNQCGSYSIEGDCYNREHSFPKSWFNDATPMHDDLFHLIASDGKVNGMRNNYPYGNVTSATYTSLYGGKLGTGTTNSGYSGTVFEPIDEYKGDFARGYFYMATRYENVIASWLSNTGANDVLDGTSYPAFDSWQLNLLRDWNNLDPVNDKEMKRNNAIYALQNNRNPFIDSPQFVQRIWGGVYPSEPNISASGLSITNNSNTSVTLNWKSGNGNRRIVLMKAASAVNGFPVDSFNYVGNSNYTSASQVSNNSFVVYNGTGSNVTVTNLTQGTTYHYAIIEYNGWYSTSNYQATGYLTSNATTMPVELLSFTATVQDNENVLLNWSTASEQNNKGFYIERSTDNKNFETLDFAKGHGTTSRKNNYQYLDNLTSNLQLLFFYRLKQTDNNGTTTYSPTVSVSLNGKELSGITVSPNPFSDVLRISFQTTPQSEIFYSLKNLMGKTYVEKKANIQSNETELQIDVDGLGLEPGVYILQFEHSGKQFHYKIVKQ
jgi:endonuclease I